MTRLPEEAHIVESPNDTAASPAIPAPTFVAPAGEPLKNGELVVLADDRGHQQLVALVDGNSLHMNAGAIPCHELIGTLPGRRVRTGKGKEVTVLRPTLEEYMLLMPRAAQIITPKDSAYIVHWADVFPGAVVVEAGVGSGALTLALLRAVGETGRVIGFEQRVEFANRARKNVEAWREPLAARLQLEVADVHAGLGALSGIDRVILDLADPWLAVAGALRALKAGGLLLAYLPSIRQVDRLVHAILDRPELMPPEVVEAWLRPWIAERERLRPVHKSWPSPASSCAPGAAARAPPTSTSSRPRLVRRLARLRGVVVLHQLAQHDGGIGAGRQANHSSRPPRSALPRVRRARRGWACVPRHDLAEAVELLAGEPQRRQRRRLPLRGVAATVAHLRTEHRTGQTIVRRQARRLARDVLHHERAARGHDLHHLAQENRVQEAVLQARRQVEPQPHLPRAVAANRHPQTGRAAWPAVARLPASLRHRDASSLVSKWRTSNPAHAGVVDLSWARERERNVLVSGQHTGVDGGCQ